MLCEVAYEMRPPASGDHFPTWQNCGFYTEPIRDETAVHSLEHGAIWMPMTNVDAATRTRSLRPSTSTPCSRCAVSGPEAPNRPHRLATSACGDVDGRSGGHRVLRSSTRSSVRDGAGGRCVVRNAIGVAPEDPDRGFADAEAFFMDN